MGCHCPRANTWGQGKANPGEEHSLCGVGCSLSTLCTKPSIALTARWADSEDDEKRKRQKNINESRVKSSATQVIFCQGVHSKPHAFWGSRSSRCGRGKDAT